MNSIRKGKSSRYKNHEFTFYSSFKCFSFRSIFSPSQTFLFFLFPLAFFSVPNINAFLMTVKEPSNVTSKTSLSSSGSLWIRLLSFPFLLLPLSSCSYGRWLLFLPRFSKWTYRKERERKSHNTRKERMESESEEVTIDFKMIERASLSLHSFPLYFFLSVLLSLVPLVPSILYSDTITFKYGMV